MRWATYERLAEQWRELAGRDLAEIQALTRRFRRWREHAR
jgi:hypothetical protein